MSHCPELHVENNIHVRCDHGQTLTVAAAILETEGVFELLQALLAGLSCASLKMVPEEVKALSWKVGAHQPGLPIPGAGISWRRTFTSQIALAPRCTDSGFRQNDAEGLLQLAHAI